jgi:hypothetical protein
MEFEAQLAAVIGHLSRGMVNIPLVKLGGILLLDGDRVFLGYGTSNLSEERPRVSPSLPGPRLGWSAGR